MSQYPAPVRGDIKLVSIISYIKLFAQKWLKVLLQLIDICVLS